MDTQRLIIFAVFSLSLFMLWERWQEENASPAAVTQTAQPATKTADIPTPNLSKDLSIEAPKSAEQADAGALPLKGQRIKVKTDVILAEIDTNGGDLRRYGLIKHTDDKDKRKPYILLADEAPHNYIAQSGLIGAGLPTHKALFSAEANEYELKPGAEKLEVRLNWRSQDGVRVAKIFTFHRNNYVVDIRYELKNDSASLIKPDAYFQLLRDGSPPAGHSALLPTYTGPAIYTDEKKFQKHDFESIGKDGKDVSEITSNGWVAILQHYFMTAYLPPANVQREFYLKKVTDNLYASGVILPMGEIAPNASKSINMQLYAGPVEQEQLKNLAPGLDLAIDYGLLTVIAVPIFWLMSQIHKVLGNWGWSIIVLTFLIKLAFYPLSAASYRSMAKMKLLAPRLQRLKEQYGDDRQKMHQAMMDIYKNEKINPLGGCLPILIQIPVFIALYWVLLYSVEMRHAPFALWIQDLTAKDPYYVLPVLMGISMFVQTKLNPTPPDPIQAKIMTIMPIAFSIMFFWFPAGLVLYWVVNNILSIAQQWRINQVMQNAPKKAKR